MNFSEFPLEDIVFDGIDALGFETATPIQAQAIPLVLEGKDLIACAQTGTGKTAAYLIPTINRLTKSPSNKTRAVIICPTRELAEQIDQNVDALSYFTGVSSVAVYGGGNPKDFDRQKFGVKNGADIVVATPGRLLTFMSLGATDFSEVEVVILDEADKMLDMGFYGDIVKIISGLPDRENRQTLMFSATMPPKIRRLTTDILKEPETINLNLAKPAEGVTLGAYMVYPEQKIPLLEGILEEEEIDSMIIFAASKASVDEITKKLKRKNYDIFAIHSDKDQEERMDTLRKFKNKEFRFLVGTDVLARGIDIDNLSHVLNFDVPHDADDYVHRVGRTARASSTGTALTFISPKDQHKFARIEKLIEQEVPKLDVPEELGETPTYNPRKKGGNGRGRGNNQRRGKGGNRSGRHSNNRQRSGEGGQRPRGEGNSYNPNKKKKRRRPNNRNRGPRNNEGGNSQPTPPPSND
ncbi:MAG: DEAD/DEAH box helicase [Bacteroidia bacterium]|nr:DEAD/DEAH box helicase [Bacteroidia bacterium]